MKDGVSQYQRPIDDLCCPAEIRLVWNLGTDLRPAGKKMRCRNVDSRLATEELRELLSFIGSAKLYILIESRYLSRALTMVDWSPSMLGTWLYWWWGNKLACANICSTSASSGIPGREVVVVWGREGLSLDVTRLFRLSCGAELTNSANVSISFLLWAGM